MTTRPEYPMADKPTRRRAVAIGSVHLKDRQPPRPRRKPTPGAFGGGNGKRR